MEMIPFYRNNRHAVLSNPLRDIENFERAFFGPSSARAPFAVDIRETPDAFLIEADLPGFKKEDLHVEIENDTLTIRAERHSAAENKENGSAYVHQERSWGVYERSFDVSGVEADSISASYDGGVLTLTLPKKAEKAPGARRLEIQ